MRLKIKLKVGKDFVYDKKYYHKARGLLLKLAKEEELHKEKQPKYFCFSNIFPIKIDKDTKDVKPFAEGETKYWLISSPKKQLIEKLKEKFDAIKQKNIPINIGEMLFFVDEVSIVNKKINSKNISIKTETPIIIRVSRNIYTKYNIKPKIPYKTLFWKPSYDFNMFVDALTYHILNKYKQFYNLNEKKLEKIKKEALPLFQMFEMIKEPKVVHLIIQGKEQKMIGTFWKFRFHYLNKIQQKILNFAIDTGLSQKNSYGLGFVNVANGNKINILKIREQNDKKTSRISEEN